MGLAAAVASLSLARLGRIYDSGHLVAHLLGVCSTSLRSCPDLPPSARRALRRSASSTDTRHSRQAAASLIVPGAVTPCGASTGKEGTRYHSAQRTRRRGALTAHKSGERRSGHVSESGGRIMRSGALRSACSAPKFGVDALTLCGDSHKRTDDAHRLYKRSSEPCCCSRAARGASSVWAASGSIPAACATTSSCSRSVAQCCRPPPLRRRRSAQRRSTSSNRSCRCSSQPAAAHARCHG